MSGVPRGEGEWLALIVASMLATWRTLARTNGSELFERPGVLGLASPSVPERSVFNSVGYTDPGAFLDSYADLADHYARRRCAWTVWVPEADLEVARMLAGAGHVLDAAPRAMGAELGQVEEPDLGDLDWTGEASVREACLINDHAYGYPEGTWARFNDEAASELRNYVARLDGRPVATVATIAHGSDCEIWSVATETEARGRGLSTALMRQALWDARKDGLETSTLQGTMLGRPVYERVGFADFGALQMWELRPAELAGEARRMPPA
jgi:GNAT superfamily N-acetyltransferase